jgi:hypothetical protein
MMVTETDIANRALQRVGCERIALGALWTEDSKNASEIRACYHMLRRAEINRNVWRFSIRKCALRAINDFTSKLVTFAAWATGTTYAFGDIAAGSDAQIYMSLTSSNIAHDPTIGPDFVNWSIYFGNLIAQEYVTDYSATVTYAIGDHCIGSDLQTYVSLVAANIVHDPVGDGAVHWDLAKTVNIDDDAQRTYKTSFYAGEIVYRGSVAYISLQNNNEDVPPSSKWNVLEGATVAKINFMYPIGAGPSRQVTTKNVFHIPNGFMKIAPQDPLAGATSFLGAPGGLAFKDWEFEGNYFTSRDCNIVIFRFAADIIDPAQFNPMFCEGLGSRVALEICEPLTQSAAKLQAIASEYKNFMGEARLTNGIETGPTYPPEDDYITTRY